MQTSANHSALRSDHHDDDWFRAGQPKAPDWIEVLYTPLDFWPVMRRAFAVIRPMRIVLVEAEVWPNLTAIAHRAKNSARSRQCALSPRSEGRFRSFNLSLGHISESSIWSACRNRKTLRAGNRWAYAARPDSSSSAASNSIREKIEAAPIPSAARGSGLRSIGVERPILLGGSTHRGRRRDSRRESFCIAPGISGSFSSSSRRAMWSARGKSRTNFAPSALHVARCERSGDGRGAPIACSSIRPANLRDWYSIATIVFMGKSLTARGGQNPVEAIVADNPVIFGPHMENFAALAQPSLRRRRDAGNDEIRLTTTLAELFARSGGS